MVLVTFNGCFFAITAIFEKKHMLDLFLLITVKNQLLSIASSLSVTKNSKWTNKRPRLRRRSHVQSKIGTNLVTAQFIEKPWLGNLMYETRHLLVMLNSSWLSSTFHIANKDGGRRRRKQFNFTWNQASEPAHAKFLKQSPQWEELQ